MILSKNNCFLRYSYNNDAIFKFPIFLPNMDYWGKGIAQKATMLVLNYGFNPLNLQTIWLEVDSEHKSAVHLYEKCGFTYLESPQNGKVLMEIQNNA